jgi:hypothetical protein
MKTHLCNSQKAQKHENRATGEHNNAGRIEDRIRRLHRMSRGQNPGRPFARGRWWTARSWRWQQLRRNLQLPRAVVQRTRRQWRRLRMNARETDRVWRRPRGHPPPVRNSHWLFSPNNRPFKSPGCEFQLKRSAAFGDAPNTTLFFAGRGEVNAMRYYNALKGIPLLVPTSFLVER